MSVTASLRNARDIADAANTDLATANRRIAQLEDHIKSHDDSCQDQCGHGDQDAAECGMRAYFEYNGRRCVNCPVHDKIGLP